MDKATEANGGTLQIKDSEVAWALLEGDVEKDILKKIIQAQQESYTRNKGRGTTCTGQTTARTKDHLVGMALTNVDDCFQQVEKSLEAEEEAGEEEEAAAGEEGVAEGAAAGAEIRTDPTSKGRRLNLRTTTVRDGRSPCYGVGHLADGPLILR